MRLAPIVCLLLSCAIPSAHAATRAETLNALMEAEGVGQAFDSARDMVRQQAKADADKGMASLLTRLDATPEVIAELRRVYGEFIDSVTTGAFQRDELAKMWSDAYGASFSDEELAQLLAFYQSPLGQKTVSLARSAMPKVMEKMQTELQPRLQPAIQRYTEQVRKIVADCKCERKDNAPAQ
jgi:hypothetical protein